MSNLGLGSRFGSSPRSASGPKLGLSFELGWIRVWVRG